MVHFVPIFLQVSPEFPSWILSDNIQIFKSKLEKSFSYTKVFQKHVTSHGEDKILGSCLGIYETKKNMGAYHLPPMTDPELVLFSEE